MTFPVVLTKLAIPRPPAQFIARPPLWGRLKAALEQHHRVTLLCAPAGFGKSTMLSSWIEQAHLGQVVWVSLEPQDDHLDQFLAYLHAAVTRIYPTLDFSSAGAPLLQGESAYRVFFTTLINTLATESRPLIVILDDYHVLTDQLIHNAVTFLIDYLPPSMHLIIASRVDPPLPLARLRARRQLTELRASDLRFSRDEMRELFTLLLRDPPPDELVSMLEQRTEGWAAGLHLAALGLQGHEPAPFPRLSAPLALTQRYIFDYLADEVFVMQPDATQAFLMQTAILPRLCGSLCDAVTGQEDGAEILRALERNNLFLTRLDDQGVWYRYHQLFRDFLCRRLEQNSAAAEVADLHRRASRWYAHQGVREEAIHHALLGEDWAGAIALFPTLGQLDQVFQRPSAVLGWIEALPAQLQAAPPLQLLCCWALVLGGQMARARQLIPRLKEQLRPEHGPVALGALAVVEGYTSALTGAPQQGVQLLKQALELLTPDERWLRMLALGFLCSSYRILGQIRQALPVLAEARASQLGEDSNTWAIVTVTHAHIALLQADLAQAAALSAEVCRQAVRVSYMGVPDCYLIRGLVAYERDDLAGAEALAREAISAAKLVGRYEYWPRLPLLLARVLDLRGEGARASALLAEALRMARALNNGREIAEAQAYLVERWVRQGGLGLAAQELAAQGLALDAAPSYLHLPLLLAQAKLLLAQQRAGDRAAPLALALKQLEQLSDDAGADGRHDHSIKLLALRALLHAALQQPSAALALLGEALGLGQTHGYRRAFLDLGAPMAELLAAPGALILAPDYVQELRQAFTGEPFAPAPLDTTGPPALLSERELEVLRLIVQGRSVRDVAEVLVISLHTTRTHLRNIYSKLDAHTRLEAVESARALGLL